MSVVSYGGMRAFTKFKLQIGNVSKRQQRTRPKKDTAEGHRWVINTMIYSHLRIQASASPKQYTLFKENTLQY